MFRLEVSHLQTLTTFSLPDALPTLRSHSVYSCGICTGLQFMITKSCYRLCLNIKTSNHEDSFLYSALMYSRHTAVRYCWRIAVGVGVLLFYLLDMDSCVSLAGVAFRTETPYTCSTTVNTVGSQSGQSIC